MSKEFYLQADGWWYGTDEIKADRLKDAGIKYHVIEKSAIDHEVAANFELRIKYDKAIEALQDIYSLSQMAEAADCLEDLGEPVYKDNVQRKTTDSKVCRVCERVDVEFYNDHKKCKDCLEWWYDGGCRTNEETKQKVLKYGSYDNYLQHQGKTEESKL